ncbi:hypothetical protein LTR17_021331 [Elasticomyces elasticus]|nr:hypothetical protein LTR17_021331 [Elasticomyces elasticus]
MEVAIVISATRFTRVAMFRNRYARKLMEQNVVDQKLSVASWTRFKCCAWYGDKYHSRGPIIIVNAIMGVIGLCLLGFVENVGAAYFGVFLATTSANANIPCILTFQANNIRGQWKRALCSATLVGAGGIGGIVGSTVFRAQNKPGYRPDMYATIIASGLIVFITLALDLKFKRANKRAASGGKPIEGLPGFRYTL